MIANALARPLLRLVEEADAGDWQPLLRRWADSDAGRALIGAVDSRVAAGATVFPAQVFRAFEATPLARTRVVVVGQDPYHTPGMAEGLAFSVPPGAPKLPPSLRNIIDELRRDLRLPPPAWGSLLPWARQGVLLLNTSLTVEQGLPGSHARLGWQSLTDAACRALAADAAPKVFLLWGAHAQALAPLLGAAGGAPENRHLLLSSNHPSPLSARRPPLPFIGCGHFSRANAFLAGAGRGTVDWQLA